MTSAAPRLFSIPPGAPFLPTLAQALTDGTLIEGFAPGNDPLALASATIYVPTRRAARALRSHFVEHFGGRSAILPRIRPLGDFDEDADYFDAGADPKSALTALPPIAGNDRVLLLAALVRKWREQLPAEIEARIGERVVMPTSTADAIWFARDLADLMDEVETEGSDWTLLSAIAPGDVAEWWQVTRRFLEIVTEYWPAVLEARQRSSPASYRSGRIRAEAERLTRTPPSGPVVAAGSTGSIPATAELLSVVARLPQGCVVLPGLDLDLDADAFKIVGGEAAPASVFGHSQFGLAKLLRRMGASRDIVSGIGYRPAPLAARARLVSEALRPAEATDRWAETGSERAGLLAAGALDGVTLIEAAQEREEAQAIALVLRDAIEEDGKTAALVTGNRELARRVSIELRRFGIRADDSGGSPLASAPGATLLRLLTLCIFDPGDVVALSALLKHPLLRVGMAWQDVRRAVETIDLVALRGGAGRLSLAGLRERLDKRLLADERDKHLGRLPFMPTGEDVAFAVALAGGLLDAVAPLLGLARERETDTGTATRMTAASLEALCRDEQGVIQGLYDGEAGARLAGLLRELIASPDPLGFEPAQWPRIVEALLAGETVKPQPGGHPRLFVWGALEARLQSVDTLVIGDLNEGSWPPRVRADRYLSRAMKAVMNLEPPERRLGLAAHDFEMAMGMPRVVLTRAARSGDAPAIASRWLQRLEAFVGKDETGRLKAQGRRWLDWTRALNGTPGTADPAPRPRPKPPLDKRPKRYSVTDIETLIRDPYAVHARKVMRIAPLEPLIAEYGPRERGSLIHEVLEHAVRGGLDPNAPGIRGQLIAIADALVTEWEIPADIVALWRPRIVATLAEFLAWEAGRDYDVAQRIPETKSAHVPIEDTGVTLSARADRIDILRGGMATVIDYKTGVSPSAKQAHILLSPQLPLEGALMERGGFAEAGAREPSDLVYLRLKADGSLKDESILEATVDRVKSVKCASQLAGEAWEKLVALVRFYNDEANGFVSRRMPFKEGEEGDFDHLARVREWTSAKDNEGGTDQ